MLISTTLSTLFRKVRQWLHSLGPPSQVTVIPGNHDAYVQTAWDPTFAQWLDYMATDAAEPPGAEGTNSFSAIFPSLRILGMVALIGVSTARPSAPLLAIGTVGAAQLEKLAEILTKTGKQGLFRVVLIHHPPGPATVTWHKRLTDGDAFRQVLAQRGAELLLHGHAHRTSVTHVQTPSGIAPAIGVPSASAYSHEAKRRARYHLYRLSSNARGWDVCLTVRGYSIEKDRFTQEHNSKLQIVGSRGRGAWSMGHGA